MQKGEKSQDIQRRHSIYSAESVKAKQRQAIEIGDHALNKMIMLQCQEGIV